MTKDVIAAIEERRSVREFEQTPIPDALREADRVRQSGAQRWKFGTVEVCGCKTGYQRQALASAAYGQDFIEVAPVCIVVCG